MKRIRRRLQWLLLLLLLAGMPVYAEKGYAADSLYKINQQYTPACYEYMTRMYIQNYPAMGLEFEHGTKHDQQILKRLADTVTAGKKTPLDKANAIARWVKRNIQYQQSCPNAYAQDVFEKRTGNCYGYGVLMKALMRLAGIPTVMHCGIRGDQVKVLNTANLAKYERDYGHAWVCAYINGVWYLFDPLFGEYGQTSQAYIQKWYFSERIEGITPTYPGMDLRLIYGQYGASNIYYINGKFMAYVEGVPGSQHYQDGYQLLQSMNGVPLLSFQRYAGVNSLGENTGSDGIEYVDEPSRKDSMVDDECFTDGWITYGATTYQALPNGILYTNTVSEHNGKTWFVDHEGSLQEIVRGDISRMSLSGGFPAIQVGETIQIVPEWKEDQIQQGRILVWENASDDPSVISLDEDGTIHARKPGFARVYVCSKETKDGDTHWYSSFISVQILNKARAWDYTDHTPKETGNTAGKASSVKVSFKGNGGSTGKTSMTVRKGAAIGKLPKCVRNGYTFAGWFTQKTGGKQITTGTKLKRKTTLYAHWVKGKLPKAVIRKIRKTGRNTMKITYTGMPAEKGYEIRYSTQKNMTGARSVKTKKKVVTLKKLQEKTRYYVQVRVIRKDTSGREVYGAWSKIKTVNM